MRRLPTVTLACCAALAAPIAASGALGQPIIRALSPVLADFATTDAATTPGRSKALMAALSRHAAAAETKVAALQPRSAADRAAKAAALKLLTDARCIVRETAAVGYRPNIVNPTPEQNRHFAAYLACAVDAKRQVDTIR
jgi:hypothetical protein